MKIEILKVRSFHDSTLRGIEYRSSGFAILYEACCGTRMEVLFEGDGYVHCDGFIGNNVLLDVTRYNNESIPLELYKLARWHNMKVDNVCGRMKCDTKDARACVIEIGSADILKLVLFFSEGCEVKCP